MGRSQTAKNPPLKILSSARSSRPNHRDWNAPLGDPPEITFAFAFRPSSGHPKSSEIRKGSSAAG